MEEYLSQFEVLSNTTLLGLTEEFSVSRFLSGLNEEIRKTITMLKSTSLQAAFGLVQLQEEDILRENLGHVHKEPIEMEGQEIVEVLEDQEEVVQPHREAVQELDPELHPMGIQMSKAPKTC